MATSPQEELSEGFELGAYRIVRCIGAGGMGIVYEAVHQVLGKPVALKVLRGHGAASAESRSRFVREARSASCLRHPNVVAVNDVGQVGDQAYLVMELLEGESLGSLIRREGRVPPAEAADIGVPVAAALVEAHRHGIVHRDLKPDNIYLTRSVTGLPHPKVVDFGISKVLDMDDVGSQDLTGEHTFIGTPSYASPEQLANDDTLTGLTDQYSLGVVLYEAIVGHNPFAHHRSIMSILSAIGEGRYPRLREVDETVDPQLEAVVSRAMAVSPGDRFASMFALGAALLEVASPGTRAAWGGYFAGTEPPRASLPRPSQAPEPVLTPTMATGDTIAAADLMITPAEGASKATSGVRATEGPGTPGSRRFPVGVVVAGAVALACGASLATWLLTKDTATESSPGGAVSAPARATVPDSATGVPEPRRSMAAPAGEGQAPSAADPGTPGPGGAPSREPSPAPSDPNHTVAEPAAPAVSGHLDRDSRPQSRPSTKPVRSAKKRRAPQRTTASPGKEAQPGKETSPERPGVADRQTPTAAAPPPGDQAPAKKRFTTDNINPWQ